MMQECIFAEILHWMHQRGDTVGATRLISSKKWGDLKNQKFERPVVFTIEDKISISFKLASYIVDINGIFYDIRFTYMEYPNCKKFRVRIYTYEVLQIHCALQNFKTIGDMTNLSALFYNGEFNKPLTLDTKNVFSMWAMFKGNRNFNQPLYIDTRNVMDTRVMFELCAKFDQDLNWDTRNLEVADGMFFASRFNSKLPWNTRKLKSIIYMFGQCVEFNQNLKWNTINLQNVAMAFAHAVNFCQDLEWDLQNIQYGYMAFTGSGLIKKTGDYLKHLNTKNEKTLKLLNMC